MNSYNWQSGCPNYQMTAFVFFIFKSAGEGEGWFEGDSTWLIHYKKKTQKTQTATQLYCSIPSNSVLQLYSFDSGYSLVVLEDEGEVKAWQGDMFLPKCGGFFYFSLHLKCVFANILFISFIFNIKFMLCICFIIIIDLIFIDFRFNIFIFALKSVNDI